MVVVSKIDKLGRVVIPISYRQALNIKANDSLSFSLEGGAVVIRPTKQLCRLCGTTVQEHGELSLCGACIERVKKL